MLAANRARLAPREAGKRAPLIPVRYTGQTVVIVASGPSARREDVDWCRASGWPVWAVNTSYTLGCDSLYACDHAWWKRYHAHVGVTDCWTWSEQAAEEFGLHWVRGIDAEGFSTARTHVHTGSNSAFQVLNLVVLMGAARVVLLGYDMRHVDGKTHHHGDHPKGLANPDAEFLALCAAKFGQIQPLGCEVLNCTPGSAIRRFPFADLRSLA